MRGARAVGGRLGVDDIAAVDPPRAVLGRQHSFAMLAAVDGILDMERPFAARPPDDSSRFQLVAGPDSHAISFSALSTPATPRPSSASARRYLAYSPHRRGFPRFARTEVHHTLQTPQAPPPPRRP